MPAETFLTKFRPSTFDEVVGNERTIEALKAIVERKKNRPHAFIFQGPAGTGKTTTARILAKELGCKNDLIEINAANTRGIDTSRLIIQTSRSKPLSGVTVIIMDEAHALTRDAFNALLKIIEEPPNHLYFIFCTTEPEKIIKTIKSRCRIFEFGPVMKKELMKYLRDICDKEDIDIDDQVLKEVVRGSDGYPREALNRLDSVIDIEDKEEALKCLEDYSIKQNTVADICRLLMNPGNDKWKEMSTLVKNMQGEPESIRRGISEYLASVLLNGGNPKIYDLMGFFMESLYYTGRAGLVYNLYLACQVITSKK